MTTYCYLNGDIIPVSEAKVSVCDIGLLRGFGIYEALATKNGKPFRLADHTARFRMSAREMQLTIPVTDEVFGQILEDLHAKNGFKESIFRIILTGGTAQAGIEYDRGTPTFYILCEEFKPIEASNFTDGCSLITAEFERQFPRYKTVNYIEAVLLQGQRKEKQALEILYVHDGGVYECATSNFFIVKDGIVITPNIGILEGITRKVALEVARAAGTVEERPVSVDEMLQADEAFLTSSFKDIVPVVQIDDTKIGTGAVGEVTKKLMHGFEAYANAQ